jgi:hypothetical protein
MKKHLPRTFFEELDWSILMESVAEHLNHRNYSNSNRGLLSKPTIAIAIDEKLSVKEQDRLVEWVSDLIDPDYRVWFIKQLKRIGKKGFIECATAARKYDGITRQKVFTSLIRDY